MAGRKEGRERSLAGLCRGRLRGTGQQEATASPRHPSCSQGPAPEGGRALSSSAEPALSSGGGDSQGRGVGWEQGTAGGHQVGWSKELSGGWSPLPSTCGGNAVYSPR